MKSKIFFLVLFLITQISVAEESQKKTATAPAYQASVAIKVYPTYAQYLSLMVKVGLATDLDRSEMIQFLKINKINENDLIVFPVIKQNKLNFGQVKLQQSSEGDLLTEDGNIIYLKKNQSFAQNFKSNFILLTGRSEQAAQIFSLFIDKALADTSNMANTASAALVTTSQAALNVAMSGLTCSFIGGGVIAVGILWDLMMGYQYLDGKITKGNKIFCRNGHFQEFVSDYNFFLSGLPPQVLKAFEAARIELQKTKALLIAPKSVEPAITCAAAGAKLVSLRLNPESLPRPRQEYRNISNQILEKTFGTKKTPACDGSPDQLKAVQNTRRELAEAEIQKTEDSLQKILKSSSSSLSPTAESKAAPAKTRQ